MTKEESVTESLSRNPVDPELALSIHHRQVAHDPLANGGR